MVATGICATDAHVRAQRMATPLPVVLGHEGGGVVERVGATVTTVEPGDLFYHSCGRCKPCMSSHAAYCDNVWAANFAGARLDGSNGLHVAHGAEPHGHFFGQSSFATHALTHQRNTIKVPRDLPLDVMAPLGCGLQTGAGAVLKALAVPTGASFASSAWERWAWRRSWRHMSRVPPPSSPSTSTPACACRKAHSPSSGGMSILVEDAAESLASLYVEVDDLFRIADRPRQGA
ncbi:alcohol dehydrogenase catalytic domain-containing protein [Streptomyces sp. NPDC016626]|uniref:alcohol dehydrogenase catalytic domain-containing protein n=1 Tax=Streptomyces sp. NPDC016626 TaxID=3364968 RepID=UPI0036FC65B7